MRMMGCSALKREAGICSVLAVCASMLGTVSAQPFMKRWFGSLTAAGVWAQVASLYAGILAELSNGCIGQWFPAPFPLPVMGGQCLHLASSCCIFLGSSRQRNMQAMPGHLWETGLPQCGQLVWQLQLEPLGKTAL